MFRSKLVIIVCFLSCFGKAISQESGYFGRQSFIEIGTNGQIPVFSALFSEKSGFIERSAQLKKSYNTVDFTIRASIGTILSQNSAAALEFSQRYYAVHPVKNGEINRQYTDGSGVKQTEYHQAQIAFLPIEERVILPKIVFSNKAGRVPAGLTHEIGIGYSMIQLKNPNLLVNSENNPELSQSIQNQLIDTRVVRLKGLVFLYGIRMNYPITKNVLFHIGVRYQTTSLLEKKKFRKLEETESWISGREVWSLINQRRQLGILNFGAGFNLCF